VDGVRYRCNACGNLTRFDVTVARRLREFRHFTLGGEVAIDESEVLEETIEDVSCRWCGSGGAVEPIEHAAEPNLRQ
jgi:hypothetical protein